MKTSKSIGRVLLSLAAMSILVIAATEGCGLEQAPADDPELIQAFEHARGGGGKSDARDLLCNLFGQPAGCPLCAYLEIEQPYWYAVAQDTGVCPDPVGLDIGADIPRDLGPDADLRFDALPDMKPDSKPNAF